MRTYFKNSLMIPTLLVSILAVIFGTMAVITVVNHNHKDQPMTTLKRALNNPNVTLNPIIFNPIILTANNTNTIKPERPKTTISRGSQTHSRETINGYIREIASEYNMDPEFIMSIVQQESEYLPTARNQSCLGLMQASTEWHANRAKKLGVTDFYDPYGNILLGVDYISELLVKYKDPTLVLMLYNMNHDTALKLHAEGKTSQYAKDILARAETYRKGHLDQEECD